MGFDKGVSKDRQGRILAALDGRISQRFGAIRGGRLALVRPRSGRATKALLKRLRRHPDVAYAEPDFFQFASATKVPNDPFYPRDYALVDGTDDHDIDAPTAWGTRTGCAKVAILDTGIDSDHPDLKSNVYKSDDKPNNGKDDDKNGYVDDTYGYNAIKGKGRGRTTTAHPGPVRHRGRAWQQRGRCGGHLLVRATRGGEVHELKRQGLDFGRDRRHRLRGQEGNQDHQRLVRV